MAKKTKAMIEALKKQALETVTDMATTERTKSKGGVFTNRDIEAIPNEDVKATVHSRYKAYIKASKRFNKARDEMAIAKLNLQNILDKPFAKEGRITQEKHWNILGLDQTEAIIYRDSEWDYQVRFDRYISSRAQKGKPVSVGNVEAWDWTDKDTPELVKSEDYFSQDTSQGTPTEDNGERTPEGTSEDDTTDNLPIQLENNPQAYLAAYNKKRKPETRLAFYRDDLDNTERPRFFSMLDRRQQDELYPLLSPEEQSAVYNVRHLGR